jgi:hypothetical protein
VLVGKTMGNNQPQIGVPFSQVYLRPSSPMKDSQRFRNRLAAYLINTQAIDLHDLVQFFEPRMGADQLHDDRLPGDAISSLVRHGEVRDVLDSITHTGMYLALSAGNDRVLAHHTRDFHDFIQNLFEGEGLAYTLDDQFGVRYRVDMEFEHVRLAAVAYIEGQRYRAVLKEFEAAYSAVEASPPDTKLAVRSMFEAVETLFRLIAGPKAKLLGSPEIEKHLLPLIRDLYGADSIGANMVAQLGKGLADWVNGLHAYRHGQAVEEPSPPPLEAAVAALQTGSAYIRLLIELDRRHRNEALTQK